MKNKIMGMLTIVCATFVSPSYGQNAAIHRSPTMVCVLQFALNASLPSRFPGVGQPVDSNGKIIYQHIMDETTRVHKALTLYCIANDNKAEVPADYRENPAASRCVLDFALNASLPPKFPGIDQPVNPNGNVIFGHIMDEATLLHKTLATYCILVANSK